MRHFPQLLALPLVIAAPAVVAADYLTVNEAQQELFPGASFADAKVKLSEAQMDAIQDQAGVRQRFEQQPVWRAEKDGQQVGWFMVDNVIGKHEFITYALATDMAGKVLGIEVLSYRETHGGQIRQPIWRGQFLGKTLASPIRLGKDISNISGATLSCRNVTDGVRRLLTLQKLVLAP
ncbi:FMN-binding protein [Gallaecimonas kandeliae]|uniref:FMN-binding protein n=1 Tax=Gallaecimonas kandeliae TaxID=3029055 RepID=UPI002648FE0F|nr:FMN-binding protein [Gallaecimonas kandeliae]WKE64552.1 FMN-binding protein [Gallaecimonas kandeliae]